MPRWKLIIEYDGTGLAGWQKQNDAPTVQQALEDAFLKFSGETVSVVGSGRTDAGVHARAQVAHVDLAKATNAETIRDAVNFHLRPARIVLTAVASVADAFNARFDAVQRSYRYRILNRVAPPMLDADRVWHVIRPLDVRLMQEAADLLIGNHDFSTFRARECQARTPVKTLDRLVVTRNGEDVLIETAARSFLYHQVRNMAGTLSLVGSGRWTLAQFRSAFAARDRIHGGPTAPACGLTFWDVRYAALEADEA